MYYREDYMKKRRIKRQLIGLFSGLAFVVAVVAAIFMISESRRSVPASSNGGSSGKDAQQSQTGVLSEEGTIMYGDRVVAVTAGVPINSYAVGCFSEADGLMTYNDGVTVSVAGIDVSGHQDDIDWRSVKSHGIDFAMLRIGHRGYTEGKLYLDDSFAGNYAGAKAAGLHVGAYFYSQAVTDKEALEEAKLVSQWLSGYELDYPVVFDWEYVYSSDSRTRDITGEQITSFAKVFCDEIAKEGYKPMVYFNRELGYISYDLLEISGYDFWLAEYDGPPTFYYGFEMLQYSCTGSVAGISGDVDLNISFVDYAAGN